MDLLGSGPGRRDLQSRIVKASYDSVFDFCRRRVQTNLVTCVTHHLRVQTDLVHVTQQEQVGLVAASGCHDVVK
jgi:hypothetical protein